MLLAILLLVNKFLFWESIRKWDSLTIPKSTLSLPAVRSRRLHGGQQFQSLHLSLDLCSQRCSGWISN